MILEHPSIDPVIFSLGIIEIRWYALAYIASFLFGLYIIKFLNSKIKSPINDKLIDNFFTWSIVGVILGGRIGYVFFYQISVFLKEPLYIFYIWKGGMSFHGGLIGIIISIYFFSKKNNIPFFQLADLVSIVAPIGLFLGRIANFINVELIGRTTDFPFAIIYPSVDNTPRHPSQLYEAFLEGIVLFFVLNFYFKKGYLKKPGQISGLFLIFYSLFRFVTEFFRNPDLQIGYLFLQLSLGQLISIIFLILGTVLFFYKKNDN